MRVETLLPGTGPALDAFSRALLVGTGPAAGLLTSAGSLRAGTAPTGSTPRALAEAIAAEQERHGLGPRSVENAHALADGAVAVVAGQQPGLLGGPLLSLHKAAGAISLAAALSSGLSRRVVPVFWVGSEDHDWAEMNTATVLDTAGAPVELRLDVAGDHRSARDVPIAAAAVDGLLAELARILPATPRAAEAVERARPPAGADLGSWFSTLLGRLLGDAGLVVVEPHVLAPWAGPAYAALVRDAAPIAKAIRAAGTALVSRGLEAPLAPTADGAPLFVRDEPRGPRRRPSLAGAELARRVEAHPELASGDVVGRVFVQNALLPVVACVGGPTELAYWAQVAAAHAAVGRPFPAAGPRPSATWVEAKSAESLRAFGVGVADVVGGLERPPEAAAPAHDPLADRVEAVRGATASLEREIGAVPGAARHVEEMRRALEALVLAARAATAEREGRGRGRWKKTTDAIRPRGKFQERVLSPLSLVARHGVEALREGLSSLSPIAEGHQVVYLD